MANLMTAVVVIFIKDNHVLFLKRTAGWGAGTYSLPGGNVELHESLTAAAIRESHEELDAVISQENLIFSSMQHIKDFCMEKCREYILVTFSVTEWNGEIINKEPEKHSELVWFNINDLPENLSPYARETVQKYKEKVTFAEYGWN